jgi:hypothetical protein
MKLNRKSILMLVALLVTAQSAAHAARLSEPEELDKLVSKISERQSKDRKTFEKKTKAYFFDAQKPELVEEVIKQFKPGEAVTVIVLSNLSQKPVQDIATMRKSGKSWQEIADKTKVKLKSVVKDVKDFRLGIG